MGVRVELWSDGSGIATGGQPLGWAYVLRALDSATGEVLKETEGSGSEAIGTNNRAELLAVIEGLFVLKQVTTLTVFTDSEYVIGGIGGGWVEGWKAHGWKNRDGDPVKNQDLWQMLDSACSLHDVSWQHVKGHLYTWRCEDDDCGFVADNGRKRKCPDCSGKVRKDPNFPLNERCDHLAGEARKALLAEQQGVGVG